MKLTYLCYFNSNFYFQFTFILLHQTNPMPYLIVGEKRIEIDKNNKDK